MSKAKFTRGPWVDNKKDHDAPYQPIEIVGGFHRICTIWIDDAPVEDFNQQQNANANLIAAAPDLYEALQNMVRLYYSEDRQNQPGQYVRASVAALSKARGDVNE